KFKLDSMFQPSPNFTHIHQIKPGDGPDQDNPIMTITPRYKSSGNQLRLIFISPDSVTTTLHFADLSKFLGAWVEVYENILFSETGSYSIEIKNLSDETTLFRYSNNNLAMWRPGSTFIRPKWGIYRSLNSPDYLRDENVLFSDFSLLKSNAVNLPSQPGNLNAQVSGNLINLTWTDNSYNEDQFRIDRSPDSLSWAFLANSKAGSVHYSDTLNIPGIYYYRIRSENTSGNSGFSNSVRVNTNPSGINDLRPLNFILQQNYPNPFNPSTSINYQLSMSGKIKLSVTDILGRKITDIVNKDQTPGNYTVNFDSSKYNLASGVDLYSLQVNSLEGKDNFISTKRMILLK
ncbi:MAG: hypothetical protein P4L27_07415, partial [Ignavibacteriaceae bacterium]|nr:hypothetical protein [Ignavibacteriaceae bacterium]